MPKSQIFIQGALIVGLVILLILIMMRGIPFFGYYFDDLQFSNVEYSLLLIGGIFCLGASSYNMHILRKAE